MRRIAVKCAHLSHLAQLATSRMCDPRMRCRPSGANSQHECYPEAPQSPRVALGTATLAKGRRAPMDYGPTPLNCPLTQLILSRALYIEYPESKFQATSDFLSAVNRNLNPVACPLSST